MLKLILPVRLVFVLISRACLKDVRILKNIVLKKYRKSVAKRTENYCLRPVSIENFSEFEILDNEQMANDCKPRIETNTW